MSARFWLTVAMIFGLLLVVASFVLWGFAIWSSDAELAGKLWRSGVLAFIPGVSLGIGGAAEWEWH